MCFQFNFPLWFLILNPGRKETSSSNGSTYSMNSVPVKIVFILTYLQLLTYDVKYDVTDQIGQTQARGRKTFTFFLVYAYESKRAIWDSGKSNAYSK